MYDGWPEGDDGYTFECRHGAPEQECEICAELALMLDEWLAAGGREP